MLRRKIGCLGPATHETRDISDSTLTADYWANLVLKKRGYQSPGFWPLLEGEQLTLEKLLVGDGAVA